MIGRFMGAISMSQMATMKKRLLMGVSAVLTFLFVVVAIQMSAEIRGGEQVPLDKVLYYIGFLVLNYIVFIAAKSVPSRMLGLFAVVNMALITIMLLTDGDISLWMILAVGLFNSIMFSNVFTLAIDGLGKYTSQGSSLLVMMILGGAVVPPIQGVVADHIGVHAAFVVPLFCYAYLVWYGFVGSRMRKPLTEKN
jgi:FHS family L-fucose permease-like MFS transporter